MIRFQKIQEIYVDNKKYNSEETRKKIDEIKEFYSLNKIKRILISIEKSHFTLCSVLAALESQITFIPLDLSDTDNRIENIIKQTNCNLILTENENINRRLVFINYEVIKTRTQIVIKPQSNKNDIAYIMFTSGTTGNPKGVMISHNNIEAFFQSLANEQYYKNQVWASLAKFSFDAFFLDTIIPLFYGNKLVVINNKEANDVELIAYMIKKFKISAVLLPPSKLYLFLEKDPKLLPLSSIKFILSIGESIGDHLLEVVQKNLKNVTYINFYGPTETTVAVTYKDLTYDNSVSIGKVFGNNEILLLKEGKPINSKDEIGEIAITGEFLGLGYLEKSITQEKFQIIKNKKYYLTGDLGQFQNGLLYFRGRRDDQIKINGVRVELEDIDNNINRIENIIASTTYFDAIDNKLYTYYISENMEESYLKNLLIQILPKYMIPNYVNHVPKLYLNANGKISRRLTHEKYKKNISKIKIEDLFINFVKGNREFLDFSLIELGYSSLEILIFFIKIEKEFGVNFIAINDKPEILKLKIVKNQLKKRGALKYE